MPGATPPAVPASVAPGTAQPLPSPVGEYRPVKQADGSFRFEPISARVQAGVLYAYEALTHCGFTATTFDFDGSFWAPVNPAAEGAPNPPPGIGNPVDEGSIGLAGPDEAVFRSASGILVPLRRVVGPVDTFLCD